MKRRFSATNAHISATPGAEASLLIAEECPSAVGCLIAEMTMQLVRSVDPGAKTCLILQPCASDMACIGCYVDHSLSLVMTPPVAVSLCWGQGRITATMLQSN